MTDMQNVLYKGRPADEAGRLDKELRAYDFLDGLGIEYDCARLPVDRGVEEIGR